MAGFLRPSTAKPDAAHVARRQALGQLRPRLAGVGRLEDAAFRPAADHLADRPPPLVRRREQDVRVLRVEHDVADARVRADRQDRRPRRAAVGRLVQAALAARRPERALRGDVDDVRVARIDQDLADVLRGLQAHALPRLAGVGRLVDAVTEMGAALAVVFARAEPEDVRVLRIDGDAAQGERPAIVEDRREGDAAVRRSSTGRRRRSTTYQTFGFFGSISTSTMRPVVSAGPMLRSWMPLRTSAVRPPGAAPWDPGLRRPWPWPSARPRPSKRRRVVS